jgi:heat shock protein HtpX
VKAERKAAFRALQAKFSNQLNGRQVIIRRAGQLIKISHMAEAVPNDTAEAHPTTAPLFIINPLSGRGIDNLFSTHPSAENRVAALERLAREIGVGGFDGVQPHPTRAASGPWGVTGGGA